MALPKAISFWRQKSIGCWRVEHSERTSQRWTEKGRYIPCPAPLSWHHLPGLPIIRLGRIPSEAGDGSGNVYRSGDGRFRVRPETLFSRHSGTYHAAHGPLSWRVAGPCGRQYAWHHTGVQDPGDIRTDPFIKKPGTNGPLLRPLQTPTSVPPSPRAFPPAGITATTDTCPLVQVRPCPLYRPRFPSFA